jgi:DNA-binding IclR family transcriptional regulator
MGKLLPLACLSASLCAGDLAPSTEAKVIRTIAAASGGGKVECADKELASLLTGLGVSLDPGAKLAWADSDKEVARMSKQGKLVMCGSQDWFSQGASVAVTAEGGRPVIYLQVTNLALTGVTLPDSIVKLSKVVK